MPGNKPKPAPRAELPMLGFANPAAWRAWLAAHHAAAPGLWMKIGKQSANAPSITYAEALEAALCYGWIDGQKKGLDETAWLQKFTPRGPKSIWSQINRDKAEALIAAGQMQPAGLAAVEAAKADGRWAAAYAGAKQMGVPPDLQTELDRYPEAQAFFAKLNSTNRYAILFRLATAKKAETRARRLQQFVQMLRRGEKLYP
ncbi:MAG: YdeI/OmpD-associated family protein [Anaerolineales bacterium]|nr:YdeI/OmpD-associated family protein [Anaerolineales bacterium]